VHLSGTHAPYYVDPADAPFSPWVRTASWTSLAPLHNAYKNAIVAQDRSIARVVRAFVARAGSEPWLILFTSDHGEAFGEHKAIHHGQNTYDEQIHVPGFVAFGNGALDAAQVSALRAHQREPVTLLDVLPTLLDALGVLDAFPLAADRSRWQGRSWLRAPSGPRAPVPMTNCTPLFSCPLKNWGVLGDRHALVAQPWDDDFRCVDLRTGAEGLDLASPPCAELRRASRSWFDKLPNGRDNDRPR
jgi:arylsulfatase A-like enzyme